MSFRRRAMDEAFARHSLRPSTLVRATQISRAGHGHAAGMRAHIHWMSWETRWQLRRHCERGEAIQNPAHNSGLLCRARYDGGERVICVRRPCEGREAAAGVVARASNAHVFPGKPSTRASTVGAPIRDPTTTGRWDGAGWWTGIASRSPWVFIDRGFRRDDSGDWRVSEDRSCQQIRHARAVQSVASGARCACATPWPPSTPGRRRPRYGCRRPKTAW